MPRCNETSCPRWKWPPDDNCQDDGEGLGDGDGDHGDGDDQSYASRLKFCLSLIRGWSHIMSANSRGFHNCDNYDDGGGGKMH